MDRSSNKTKRYNITIPPHVRERLRTLGGGNVSRGIRRAVSSRTVAYHSETRAALAALIAASDAGEPLGHHIAALAALYHITPPRKDYS